MKENVSGCFFLNTVLTVVTHHSQVLEHNNNSNNK